MAYFIKLIGYSSADGEPFFAMELPWWNQSELMNRVKFVKSNADGFLDYHAKLSLEQVRALHEHFRPYANTGPYAYGGWQKILQPMLQELDGIFGTRAQEFSYFLIEILETESGFE